MPYIDKDARKEIAGQRLPETPGELNFVFTIFAKEYLDAKGLSYSTINDIIGALEGAKLEFYRRIAVPYENTKIEANGDVY